MGLVASLNRPGGNVTGATFLTATLGAKRLGLLRDLAPGAEVIALLADPDKPVGRVQIRDAQEAARALGQSLVVLNGNSDERIEAAFAALAPQRVGGWTAGASFVNLSGGPNQVRVFGGASAYGRLLLGFRV
jgi:putative tryptophan/tyrosine transport system substrate-binding protein